MRPRSTLLFGLALGAVCAASLGGLVLAQEGPGLGGPVAQPPGAAPAGAARGPVITLPEGAPPEEEASPPPQISNEVGAPAEPLPAPAPKKAEPMKRPRFQSAILQAVDKTSGETLRFEAKVGEPVRYKGLVITVHACEDAAQDEGTEDSFAHLDVQAQPELLARSAARVVFRGWMFASSPGLHPVEHPLYDVWLIACKTAVPAPPPAAVAKL